MRRFVVSALMVALLGGAAAIAGLGSSEERAQATGLEGLKPMQRRLVSGFAREAMQRRTATQRSAQAAAAPTLKTTLDGCPVDRGTNIRVNQECENQADPDLQGRAQAQNETAIAQDPNSPTHIVASSNDYRRGDGNCYAYYSKDDGKSWHDSTAPMSFTRGDAFGNTERQYWQAGGDTSVAWDTKGNSYLSCQTFNRGADVTQNPDESSAFYVFRSTGTGGASWNFPARPVAQVNDPEGQGVPFLDKQYLTVDNHVGSPFQDRLYVTWTLFDADGTSYIFGAFSRDHGESFSSPKLVSKGSTLCSNDQGVPNTHGTCNTNQFSQPFTSPNGTLYVVWDNYNVTGVRPGEGDDNNRAAPAAIDNKAQVLLSKSTDGGNTFSAPKKVADYYDLPDCVTYQGADEGVACVPEKGASKKSTFRAANYPVGAVDPSDPSEVDVTVASYINQHSNEHNGCVPRGINPDTLQPLYDGVKTAGACNNDIVMSRSTNFGASFTGATTDVRSLPAIRGNDPHADQYWQWAAFGPGGKLAVSYYDRAYGSDETNGFSDVSLSGSNNATSFGTTRVTTASMPPASQFEGNFFGDYSGLSAGNTAHPAWMDTRDPNLVVCRNSAGHVTQPPSLCTTTSPTADPANDENAYTRSMAIPTP